MAAILFLSIHRIPPFKWHDRTFVAAFGWLFDTVIFYKKKYIEEFFFFKS